MDRVQNRKRKVSYKIFFFDKLYTFEVNITEKLEIIISSLIHFCHFREYANRDRIKISYMECVFTL